VPQNSGLESLHCSLQVSKLTTVRLSREIELKTDTVVIVLGASGDLAKKKTFPVSAKLESKVSSSDRWSRRFSGSIEIDSYPRISTSSAMRGPKWITRSFSSE